MIHPHELEQIAELVAIYKTLPEDKKQIARGKARDLSVWQGTDAHTRRLNAELHKRFFQADLAEAATRATPAAEIAVVETAEVLRALKPVVIFAGGIAAIGGAGWLLITAIVSIGKAIEAFFIAYGGGICGGAFAVFVLLAFLSGARGEKPEPEEETPKSGKTVIVNVNVDGEQKVKVG